MIKRNLKKLILILGITMLIRDGFILLIGGSFTSFRSEERRVGKEC